MKNRDLDGVVRGLRDVRGIMTGTIQDYTIHRREEIASSSGKPPREVTLSCGARVVFNGFSDQDKDKSRHVE